MRATLIVLILFPALLAGCASNKGQLNYKSIGQTGALKVHPGLLGQPVPQELQPEAQPVVREQPR